MFRLFAPLALLWLAITPALAQPAPAPAPQPVTVRVGLQTSEGPIVLELEKERAPITTANFLRYVAPEPLGKADPAAVTLVR